MAEGFESYHVPQQSRRDKLRVLDAAANIHGGCSGLFPHYALDSLTYAAGAHDFHHHPHSSSAAGLGGACRTSAVKEEGANLMATSYGGMNGAINFVTSIDASISSNHANYYPDLQSSIPINPPPIQEIRNDSNNPFLYASQNLRNYDHPHHHQSCNGSLLTLTHHDSSIGTTAQGLSLSLSPSSSSYCNGNSTHRTNPPPAALNLKAYGSPASAIFTDIASRRGSISVGYASILKGSRFLRPAQQLLEEFCVVGCGIYSEKAAMAAMDSLGDLAGINDHDCGNDCGSRKKPRLISILDEVCRKYKQYYQQFQAVVASFESVPGLGNAAPFANLALKALSKNFRSLKNAITDQLLLTAKTHGHISYGKEGSQRIGNTDRGLYSQRTVQNSGFLGNQPIWRTQRGLPERAVTVLRAWLFEHFLHPYPSDGDKLLLAKQTGLSRSQVSNWFINARVRLWKPMVEEIHTLEARQAKTTSQRDEPRTNMPKEQLPSPNSLASENLCTSSAQSMLDAQYKGSSTRNELPDELADLSYRDASNDGHVASGVGAAACGSSGVSLTLGLHKGVGLSEPFPVGPAQHFGLGLDPDDGGYVTASGFEAQNRQLGRDVFGGQLLHDFVG